MDRFLLAPPFGGSTRTDFNFVHASRALKASSSVRAAKKSAKVVDKHLLQCLLNSGGISEIILKSV